MPSELSRPQASLVGRQQELANLRRLLLAPERLLTLTGPPGVGKTRLALEAAATVQGYFADGVFVVSLAPLADAALLPGAIADALGLADASAEGAGPPAAPASHTLVEAIGSRHILLLLDNLEHLLPARTTAPTTDVAALIGELVKACPQLTVLATSRTPLRLSIEREVPVPPLSLPSAGGDMTVEAIAVADAVRLFVERGQRVLPAFALGAHNAKEVAAVCRALDGLPLAIELAAARLRVLSPTDLVRQLDDRFALLTGGWRDVPARQQTLRAAIAWSYTLLSAEEQRVFRCLAVFAGGFDLEAAAAVTEPAAGEGSATPAVVATPLFDLLESLAQHSLLTTDAATGRLGMLELIRDYASERLRESGELANVRWRHARYYAALAAGAEVPLRTAAQAVWVTRLEREVGNLRAALAFLLECARGSGASKTVPEPWEARHLGLQLAGGLWWFWHLRSHVFEGREWLTAFLDLPVPPDDLAVPPDQSAPSSLTEVVRERLATRARALFAAGFLAWSSGFWEWDPRNREIARRCQEESLAAFRALGDRHGEAYALWGLGLALGDDPERQEATFQECLSRFQQLGDRWGIVKAFERLAAGGRHTNARRYWEEALPVARELGEPQSLLSTLRVLGEDALAKRDVVAARRYLEESRSVLESSGLLSPTSITQMALGHLALVEENLTVAVDCFSQAFRIAQEMGSRRYMGDSLIGLAATAAANGEPEHALRLTGAAAMAWRPVRTPPGESAPMGDPAAIARRIEEWNPWLVHARVAVGEERAARLLREGSSAPLERTLAEATAALHRHAQGPLTDRRRRPALPSSHPAPASLPSPPLPRSLPSPLTAREAETAALIAQGLTNREIAEALIITERTVMRHVEHILAKLGLRSRTQIAVWYLERERAGRERVVPGERQTE